MNIYFLTVDTIPDKADDTRQLVADKNLFVQRYENRLNVDVKRISVFQCLLKIEMILILLNRQN